MYIDHRIWIDERETTGTQSKISRVKIELLNEKLCPHIIMVLHVGER